MAARVGLAFSTVRAIWRQHGLVPHRLRVFKLSTDPAFVDKLRDVVGLYVNPPEHAVRAVSRAKRVFRFGLAQSQGLGQQDLGPLYCRAPCKAPFFRRYQPDSCKNAR